MLILKVYDNQFSTNVKKVIDEVNELKIDINLNGEGTAELLIPLETGLKQFQKFEIVETKNGVDEILFNGVLASLNVDLLGFRLTLKDENWLMNKKGVLTDKSYTSQTPKQIFDDLTTDWKNYFGLVNLTYDDIVLYNDDYSYNGVGISEFYNVVSSSTKTLTIDFKQGDNWYGILQTISEQLQLNWIVKNNIIYIDELVGVDRSTGDLFDELVYNGDNHNEDNIANVTLTTYSNVANIIMGSGNSTKVILKDNAKIALQGALFEAKSFNDGDLTSQTQNYLDFKKGDLFNYVIKTEPFGPNCNIGDKIYLRIENANEYLNYEGAVFVNKVTIDYQNATLIKNIEVQTQVVKNNYLKNRLENIEKQLLLLSL